MDNSVALYTFLNLGRFFFPRRNIISLLDLMLCVLGNVQLVNFSWSNPGMLRLLSKHVASNVDCREISPSENMTDTFGRGA